MACQHGKRSKELALSGVSDEQLSSLTEAQARDLHAIHEASGAGDYELTQQGYGESIYPFVDSYDVATPQWTPEFLAEVQANIRSHRYDVDVYSGLTGSLEEQANANAILKQEIDTELDQLLLG